MFSAFSRWDEFADAVPPAKQAQFRRDLDEYLERILTDKNAPWPDNDHQWPPQDDGAGPWDAEQFDWGGKVSYAFTRPGKPPVTAFHARQDQPQPPRPAGTLHRGRPPRPQRLLLGRLERDAVELG